MHYEKTVDVQAPPELLWRAVTRVTEWPQWSPTIDEVVLLDDALGPHARVRMRQPKLRTTIYTVDEWQPGAAFSWTANTSGVRVRAVHRVLQTDGGSRLLLTIDMTGPMAPLLVPLVGARTRRYADFESDGLRRFAEQLAAGPHAA
jgi:uncharacterized protein YndB with AHSA1/START domain